MECVPDKATVFAKLETLEVNAKWSKWFEDIIVNLSDSKGNLIELKKIGGSRFTDKGFGAREIMLNWRQPIEM